MKRFVARLVLLCFSSVLISCGSGTPGNTRQPVSSGGIRQPTSSQILTETIGRIEQSPAPAEPQNKPLDAFVQNVLADVTMENVDTEAGQRMYDEVCAPCHGQDATGIAGIDVNLRRSKFVGGATMEQLAVFLIYGLGINNPFNITEIRMPPRGGRDELTNQDMLNMAAYLKSINTQNVGEERVSAYFEWLQGVDREKLHEAPEIGKEGLTGAALDGQTTYLRFCAVCHGPNGEGVESLGKGFRNSTFVADLSDEGLVEFLSVGRADDHPLNETGIEMLPFGGQPYLTDEQLNSLVAYVRAVNTGDYVPPIPSDMNGAASGGEPLSPQQEEAFALIENLSPRCFACHVIGNRGNKNGPGPNLNGLKMRASERVPGLSAEEYVRQSIMDPGSFLVDECPRGPCVDVMSKNYSNKLTDKDLDILIPFLLSLPEGQ
jgi:mono/diheme cytochrome c family protein